MSVNDLALYGVLPALALAIVLTVIRLLRGPSLPDRVMALDLLTTLGIGVIAIYAIATDQPAFLDVAIATALISFLGTVAFAYYIERTV
ncbi:MAG: cation:proton antiporter [Aggregatilineaceae bacterium]